jgi:hypothetical protein
MVPNDRPRIDGNRAHRRLRQGMRREAPDDKEPVYARLVIASSIRWLTKSVLRAANDE